MPELEQRMPEILAGLGLTVLAGSVRKRPSQRGQLRFGVGEFTCPSREMYERAHAALRADPASAGLCLQARGLCEFSDSSCE